MKKVIVLSSVVFVFGLLAGCGQQNIPTELVDVSSDTGDVQEGTTVENQNDQTISPDLKGIVVLNADTQDSIIIWSAKRVLYGYTGEVYLKEGTLTMEDGIPTQGSFVLDMTNFTLNGSDRARDDIMNNMFEVDTYPESTLVITAVDYFFGDSDQFTITADLTIKDVTNEVTFVAVFTPDRRSASASFSINRTRRGLTYQSASVFSGLGDKAINDTIEFDVELHLE